MLKNTVLGAALMLFVSCGGPEIWIPQASSRAAVTREHVQYLEQPPTRPYAVIGIITPPSGEYETLAEAVKRIRQKAAQNGGDGVFIESQTSRGLPFNLWSPSCW